VTYPSLTQSIAFLPPPSALSRWDPGNSVSRSRRDPPGFASQPGPAGLFGSDRAIADDTLYRCLDKLLAHKQDLFSFLRDRCIHNIPYLRC